MSNIIFGLLCASIGFYAIGVAVRLVRDFNAEVRDTPGDHRKGRKVMREMVVVLWTFGAVFVGLGAIVSLDPELQIPLDAILWVLIVIGAVGSCLFGAYLLIMMFHSRLSRSHAVVESVALEEVGSGAPRFSVIVRLASEGGSEEFQVQLWASDRRRAERSARYRKAIDFYVPGRRILIYRNPVLGFIPEMPVLPIGIVVALVVMLIGLALGVFGLHM